MITGLGVGGAEGMLYKLINELSDSAYQPTVVSLSDVGSIGENLLSLGVDVEALGMQPNVPSPAKLFRLVQIIKRQQPSVIQSWMYHADLAAGIAAKMAGNTPVVWNIRNSNLDLETKKITRVVSLICSRLANRLTEKIVCCSEASKYEHVKLGYPPELMRVIPNGFDMEKFRPCQEFRDKHRTAMNVDPGATVIGLVARYDSQKDFPNFIRAAGLLCAINASTVFVMVGDQVDWQNKELAGLINDAGVAKHVRLLGKRDDVSELTCAFDIATSSSKCNEGFSNTVGEAMACGIPCVVTDVGDAGIIVGETGVVVVPGSPECLAGGWKYMIEIGQQSRLERGQLARARIKEFYSIENIAHQYSDLYHEVIENVRH